VKKGLVVVESPAKARTIGRILGRNYTVLASLGHIRDLPKSKLGVDVEHGFEPQYVVPKAKSKVVSEIREAATKADAVYLATDPDREGEAISWHLIAAAKLESGGRSLQRVVFHEITSEAVTRAFKNPRDIDMHLVEAQQARRVLDRLVGYKLSPLLWKKVQRGLSAGRVQSVAVRLIVDREREIEAFVAEEFWILRVKLTRPGGQDPFWAKVVALRDGKKLTVGTEAAAVATLSQLVSATYAVADVTTKSVPHKPAAPFTTSTLQQEASRRLRFTASQTMAVAQQLYEGVSLGKGDSVGLITYMRTDSPHLAAGAVSEIRDFIGSEFGPEYVPSRPHRYTSKSKFAQEAHEAIRPTGITNTPERLKAFLDARQLKLYTLIWQRAIASQMSPSVYENVTVSVDAATTGSGGFLLEAVSSRCTFQGFERLYRERSDEAEQGEDEGLQLPELKQGERLAYAGSDKEQKFTQPPARYTEATLVRALEQKGIGRPSTYAPTLSVIQYREYVMKEAGRFRPTKLGLVVNDLLSEHFPRIVDVGFTAKMETQLDDVAQGERDWVSVVSDFYQPFSAELQGAEDRIAHVNVTEPTDEVCPNCGKPMVVRTGRFGRFVACSGYPECKTTKKLSVSTGAHCPECGADIVVKRSKKGKTFYGCSRYPACTFAMPRKPVATPCPKCGKVQVPYGKSKTKCLSCGAVTLVASAAASAEDEEGAQHADA